MSPANFGTAACPACGAAKRTVRNGVFASHPNAYTKQRCERSGSPARDIHPVKEARV